MSTAVYSLIYQTVLAPPKMTPKDLLDHLQTYVYKGVAVTAPKLANKTAPIIDRIQAKTAPVSNPVQANKTAPVEQAYPSKTAPVSNPVQANKTAPVKQAYPSKTAPDINPVFPPHKRVPQKNTLFWTIYHAIHGPPLYAETYDMKHELQERHKIADYFRDKARLRTLKDRTHRLTNADVEEIVSGLLTLSVRKPTFETCFGMVHTDLLQVLVLAHYYRRNVVVTVQVRRIYTLFVVPEEEADTLVLDFDPSTNLFRLVDAEEGDAVQNKYVKMENCRSPLKVLSHYKVGDLTDMAQQLGLSELPKKKEELYKRIVDHCRGNSD